MDLPKRLRESVDVLNLRCFGCRRVVEARGSDLPVDGEDSRQYCRVCGYRSVRLVMKSLDLRIVDMLEKERCVDMTKPSPFTELGLSSF